MNKLQIFIAVLTLVVASSSMAADSATPPAIYIDEGACPFECCQYRKWHAFAATQLLEEPQVSAPPVRLVEAGKTVQGLTGKVITTVLGTVEVLREHTDEQTGIKYKPGDQIVVYTYLG